MALVPHTGRTLALTLAVCAVAGGCHPWAKGRTEVIRVSGPADPELAAEHHRQGVELVGKGHLAKAETAFLDALAADESFGPAHNNLGLLAFERGDLYSAAQAFERALQLMPGRPEPHNNLGLVLEAAGKTQDAVVQYQQARAIAPNSAEFLGNLVRARRKLGEPVALLKCDLEALLFLERRPEWIHWAEEQLSLFMREGSAVASPASGSSGRPAMPEVLPMPSAEPVSPGGSAASYPGAPQRGTSVPRVLPPTGSFLLETAPRMPTTPPPIDGPNLHP